MEPLLLIPYQCIRCRGREGKGKKSRMSHKFVWLEHLDHVCVCVSVCVCVCVWERVRDRDREILRVLFGHNIGLAKRFLQFLGKNKRHIFYFHQELYWTMYSPFGSTTFWHFSDNFLNSIFPKLFIFLSKELFQVPFTVF